MHQDGVAVKDLLEILPKKCIFAGLRLYQTSYSMANKRTVVLDLVGVRIVANFENFGESVHHEVGCFDVLSVIS